MGTVVIGATTYTILGEHTGAGSADEYLDAALHATGWASATSDQQKQALVTATRTFDRLTWSAAYDTHAERDAVTAIKQAAYELAAALLLDAQTPQSGSRVKSIASKGLAIEFWGPARAGVLPTIVASMLAPYRASPLVAVRGLNAEGTEEESQFEDSDAHDVSGGI